MGKSVTVLHLLVVLCCVTACSARRGDRNDPQRNNCATKCPLNCCNKDLPIKPTTCFSPCVTRHECPRNLVEFYTDSGNIKSCKRAAKCPECPSDMPVRCDMNFLSQHDYSLSVEKSEDPPIDAVKPFSKITIDDDGEFHIDLDRDFYVIGVNFLTDGSDEVKIIGKDEDGDKVFDDTVDPGGNSNPGGNFPDGVCELPEEKVRSLTLEFKADRDQVTLQNLAINACCSS